MRMTDSFWNASLEDLKRGYIEERESYVCLLCDEKFEKGVIFPHDGILYEAERYTRIHIEQVHESVFAHLMGLDKKLTGLTELQNQLLRYFYQGMNDKEIKELTGSGSTSTIRHHRFSLKEKERQAKIFLTIFELLKEKDQHAPVFIPPHKNARMVDDRYDITAEEQRDIVQKFFAFAENGRLREFPHKEKQRLVVIREIAKRIESNRIYAEKELNLLLKNIYDDYAMIRRYLVDYGFLDRKADGSEYWLKK
nr:DUF2087 domain-containing protein [uncultured Bacillus sp.]